MRKNVCLSVMLALTVLLLASCGQKKAEEMPQPVVKAEEAMGPAESLETKVSAGSNIMEGRTTGPMLPIYFAFDSSVIEGEQVQRLETNAEFIKQKTSLKVRIEGNCDPRGTNEYNLALGERRAQSAKKYLVTLGIPAGQLSTVSWGEEKLLLFGHDELSWAQNRRDDFVVVQ